MQLWTCDECGSAITGRRRKPIVMLCNKCRAKANGLDSHLCAVCNNPIPAARFSARRRKNRIATCSPQCKGRLYRSQNHPLWIGGRTVDKSGYVRIRVDGRYVLEHRHIMETIIGRSLLPTETVHHRDGIRSNNSPANLELWVGRHGRNQRWEDWAKSFILAFVRNNPRWFVVWGEGENVAFAANGDTDQQVTIPLV